MVPGPLFLSHGALRGQPGRTGLGVRRGLRKAALYRCPYCTAVVAVPLRGWSCEWSCQPENCQALVRTFLEGPAAPPRWGRHVALCSLGSTVVGSTVVGSRRCRERASPRGRHHVQHRMLVCFEFQVNTSSILVLGLQFAWGRIILQTSSWFL